MTPQKQLNLHKPDEGIWGDCGRTAIACLLDLAPAEVPHFYDQGRCGDDAHEHKRSWLRARGLVELSIPFTMGYDDLQGWMRKDYPGLYYTLMGTSRTGCNHVVICLDGEIVHDPSLTDAGIVGPADDGYFWCEFLMGTPKVVVS